jgi:hypothetical protein
VTPARRTYRCTPRTRIRVTRAAILTAWGITLRQNRDHPGRKLFSIDTILLVVTAVTPNSRIVVQKHVHVFQTILQ